MKLFAFACAALLALGVAVATTGATAGENCPTHCAEGSTWSPDSGTCVPQTPST